MYGAWNSPRASSPPPSISKNPRLPKQEGHGSEVVPVPVQRLQGWIVGQVVQGILPLASWLLVSVVFEVMAVFVCVLTLKLW
jgi:hypothetical protein